MPGSPSCSGPGPQWCAGWPGIAWSPRPVGRPRPGRARCPVGHRVGTRQHPDRPGRDQRRSDRRRRLVPPLGRRSRARLRNLHRRGRAQHASHLRRRRPAAPSRRDPPPRAASVAWRHDDSGFALHATPIPRRSGRTRPATGGASGGTRSAVTPTMTSCCSATSPIGRPGPTSAWHPTTGGRSSMSRGVEPGRRPPDRRPLRHLHHSPKERRRSPGSTSPPTDGGSSGTPPSTRPRPRHPSPPRAAPSTRTGRPSSPSRLR